MSKSNEMTVSKELNRIMEEYRPGFSHLSLGDKAGILVNLMNAEKAMASTFSEKEIAVISRYPDFKNHYEILIEQGYMKKDGDGLKWLKSKQCLAEYFGRMSKKLHPLKNVPWGPVHVLFNCNQLNAFFSKNGSTFKKESRDYQELKKLLCL